MSLQVDFTSIPLGLGVREIELESHARISVHFNLRWGFMPPPFIWGRGLRH